MGREWARGRRRWRRCGEGGWEGERFASQAWVARGVHCTFEVAQSEEGRKGGSQACQRRMCAGARARARAPCTHSGAGAAAAYDVSKYEHAAAKSRCALDSLAASK